MAPYSWMREPSPEESCIELISKWLPIELYLGYAMMVNVNTRSPPQFNKELFIRDSHDPWRHLLPPHPLQFRPRATTPSSLVIPQPRLHAQAEGDPHWSIWSSSPPKKETSQMVKLFKGPLSEHEELTDRYNAVKPVSKFCFVVSFRLPVARATGFCPEKDLIKTVFLLVFFFFRSGGR